MTQQLTDRLYINPKPNALRSKGMPQNMKILIRYTNVFQESFVPVLISPRFGIILLLLNLPDKKSKPANRLTFADFG